MTSPRGSFSLAYTHTHAYTSQFWFGLVDLVWLIVGLVGWFGWLTWFGSLFDCCPFRFLCWVQ